MGNYSFSKIMIAQWNINNILKNMIVNDRIGHIQTPSVGSTKWNKNYVTRYYLSIGQEVMKNLILRNLQCTYVRSYFTLFYCICYHSYHLFLFCNRSVQFNLFQYMFVSILLIYFIQWSLDYFIVISFINTKSIR